MFIAAFFRFHEWPKNANNDIHSLLTPPTIQLGLVRFQYTRAMASLENLFIVQSTTMNTLTKC